MEYETEDAAAVGRVLDGNADAFRELVARYGDSLYRFCAVRLGSADDAEDAVQEVFVRAFKSLGSFDLKRSFRAWLFAIAANRVKTRYAAKGAQAVLAQRVAAESAAREAASMEDSNVEHEILTAMAAEEVRDALSGLAPKYRAPVEMYYFGGLSVSEVASALGLGVEAVKTRLFRARAELAVILAPEPQPGRPGKGI